MCSSDLVQPNVSVGANSFHKMLAGLHTLVQVRPEGCLSVPGLIGTVERPEKIKIRATGLDGELHEYEFEGFDARVMCHENDHLNGILYVDKASDIREPAAPEEETDNTGESV